VHARSGALDHAVRSPSSSVSCCASGTRATWRHDAGDHHHHEDALLDRHLPPCGPQTDRRYRVMASRPQGVPPRLVALHRVRFVQAGLNATIAIAARQATFQAVRVCGLACDPQTFSARKSVGCTRHVPYGGCWAA